jgi:pimeloyl-ACP methyl ester carboxylesterase
MPRSFHLKTGLAGRLSTLLGAAVAVMSLSSTVGAGDAQAGTRAKPTIVFVHGAFADASGFAGVTSRLQHDGYTVISPANPLRGLASDAAYVASVLKTIPGPIVLVGHSYGGAVISEAAHGLSEVRALVYLDGDALDAGESTLDIAGRFPGGKVADALRMQPFPQPDGTEGTDVYLDRASFRAVFAADVPARVAADMASTQRPVTLAAFQEKATEPAWKTIPSWYLIGRDDQVIDPAAQRFMATRAHSHTLELDTSHVGFVSHPAEVTKLILQAAQKTA